MAPTIGTMLLTDLPSIDVETLRSRLYGDVFGPDDEGWDEARRAWNLAVDQRPAAVALPLTDSDVVEVVNFAREAGLRVAPQGTGHGASAIASLEHTILLSTRNMRGVRIDPSTRRARVRAGALWADVTAPASAYGLAPLAGSSPDVGVVGYTLGGGLSWLARKYGFACDSVTSIELVTADGVHRLLSAHSDPELFRALCGGGGNFGVVTAIEFELYPVEALTAGAMAWPWERAAEIFTAWREWTAIVPDDITSLCRMLQVPDLPDVPAPLRGRKLVVIEAAILGDPDLLAPLRALEPELDLFAAIAPAGLIELHNDPKQPMPGPGRPPAARRRRRRRDRGDRGRRRAGLGLAARLGRAAPPRRRAAGRRRVLAVRRRRPDGRRDSRWRSTPTLARLMAATAPFDAGRALLNFTEKPQDAGRFFDGYTLAQLRAVKHRVDGGDLFAANHPL